MLDRSDDGSLVDGVAVANLRIIGDGVEVGAAAGKQGVAVAAGQQIERRLRQRFPALEELQEAAAGIGSAEQNRTGQLVVANHDLLVDAVRRIEMAYHLGIDAGSIHIAHHGQIDAHDLE